ncbi:MAG: anthranilate phosphoribosyltransferase [Candidatus Methylacidiphilales bacterium]|nr:anthranilate phosphoribosyltransferase [Candidatus Methylacidiphilales bacterium]
MKLFDLTQHCREGGELTADQIAAAVPSLLDSAVDEAEKADFLRALTDKGETPGELAAFVRALLPLSLDPGLHRHWQGQRLFDCCGTGGGGLNLVNISTGMMFILAACGVPVVKHGNRGVTKKSGSADVLAALGVPVAQNPEHLSRQLETLGLTFVAAPVFHPAFKHLAPLRQKLAAEGRRTVFNLLGPLLNPSRPASQMIGVFKKEHLDLFAGALAALGRESYSAIYGEDATGRPLGEASVDGFTWTRGNAGLEEKIGRQTFHDTAELLVESPDQSAGRIDAVLRGPASTDPALREMLVWNAACALRVHGSCSDNEEAEALAAEALDSGRAHEKLKAWREVKL